MRFNICLVFILASFFGYSQNNDFFKIPELTIPSPQASEITKYGDVSVDESTGMINPSVPIGNYTVGTINIPISLSYNGGGIKVMQTPTWTGMSWVLNAGGVITRVVKDLPDETNKTRAFYSREDLDDLITTEELIPGFIANYLPEQTISVFKFPDEYDSEVDEFNFSFPGYSGSFYLKEVNGVFSAHLEKHELDLKIEILGNFTLIDDYEFVITTPDGYKYYFGGMTTEIGISIIPPTFTYEKTQFTDRSVNPPVFGREAKTAFYLRKIESRLGDIVYFEYFEKDHYQVISSRNESISFMYGSDNQPSLLLNGGVSNSPNLTNHLLRNDVYLGKFLKRIWSQKSSNQVVFNSTEILDPNPSPTGNTSNLKYMILNNIDFGYKKVDFNYFPSEQIILNGLTDKFLIESVKTVNSNGTLENDKYNFEYDSPISLPSNLSNSQDYLGYYNGQTNSTLIPRNTSDFFEYYLNRVGFNGLEGLIQNANFNTVNLANRDPYFTFATKGILKKIQYPTGGYTAFEYEPVDKKLLREDRQMYIYSNKGNTYPYYTPNSIYSSGCSIGGFITEEGGTTPPLSYSQAVSINVTIETDSPNNLDPHDGIYLKVMKMNSVTGIVTSSEYIYNFPSSASLPSNQQTVFNKVFNINLSKNNNYHFEIGFRDHATKINLNNSSIFTPTPMVVNASFTYLTGFNNDDGLGIRLKRTKDYSDVNSSPVIKRYYYNKINHLNDEFEINKSKIYHPLFHSMHAKGVQEPNDEFGFSGESYATYHLSLNSNDICQDLAGSNYHIYKDVTISLGGDYFQNGGIEKSFFSREKSFPSHFTPINSWNQPYTSLNTALLFNFLRLNDNLLNKSGLYNGTLIKESIWTKDNSSLYKVNEKLYEYNFDYSYDNIVYNVNPSKPYGDFCPNCLSGTFGLYYIGLYSVKEGKKLLIKKTDKSFIEKVPISAYNNDNQIFYDGWEIDDFDGDGIRNRNDQDYEIQKYSLMETDYKKIVTKEEYNYDHFVTMPTSIKNTSSSDNVFYETKNYYLKENFQQNINPSLTQEEIYNYNNLKDDFIIGTPFQTETYKNNELLSKTRNIYGHDSFPRSYLYKIKASKGDRVLEDRIIYSSYDSKGNPNEVSLANGTKTSYVWSYAKQPIYKFENASINEVTVALNSNGVIDPIEYDESNPIPTLNTNPFITLLPNAQVTIYNYDPITKQITSVVDPKGNRVTYHYDTFNRLEFVKDKHGNILSENNYHYRIQN